MEDNTYKIKGVTYWAKPEHPPVVGKGTLRDYLGETLRDVRKSRDMKLRDVNEISSVSIGFLSNVERGQKEASSEIIESLCDSMDVKMSDLLRMAADKLEKIGK